jgi:hypothetical protein
MKKKKPVFHDLPPYELLLFQTFVDKRVNLSIVAIVFQLMMIKWEEAKK